MRSGAGKLNKKITIQKLTVADDGFGGISDSWQDVMTTWASLEQATAREIYYAQQNKAEITHTISMRYASSIKVGMRVVYQSRVFTIETALNVEENNTFLELKCKEKM